MQILTEGDRASLSLGSTAVGGLEQPADLRQDLVAAAQAGDSYGQQQPLWADQPTSDAAAAPSAMHSAVSYFDAPQPRAGAGNNGFRSGDLDLPAPFGDRSNRLTAEAPPGDPWPALAAPAAPNPVIGVDSILPQPTGPADAMGSAASGTWGVPVDSSASDAAPQRSWDAAAVAKRYVPDSYEPSAADRAALAAGLASDTSSIPGVATFSCQLTHGFPWYAGRKRHRLLHLLQQSGQTQPTHSLLAPLSDMNASRCLLDGARRRLHWISLQC